MKRKIESKHRIEGKKLSWLGNIREWTGLAFEDPIRSTKDRNKFTTVTANLYK